MDNPQIFLTMFFMVGLIVGGCSILIFVVKDVFQKKVLAIIIFFGILLSIYCICSVVNIVFPPSFQY